MLGSFGKIVVGVYVEIKRSDGKLRSYVISHVSIGFSLAGGCFEKLCVTVNTLEAE